MKKYDKKRANYYFAYTAKRWDDLWRYDIVPDSSRLGIEGCAEFFKGGSFNMNIRTDFRNLGFQS